MNTCSLIFQQFARVGHSETPAAIHLFYSDLAVFETRRCITFFVISSNSSRAWDFRKHFLHKCQRAFGRNSF